MVGLKLATQTGAANQPINIAVRWNQFPPDTFLTTTIPDVRPDITLRELLLDHLFPPGLDERQAVAQGLNRRRNPDLPACYRALLNVADQWRAGLCNVLIRNRHNMTVHPNSRVLIQDFQPPSNPLPGQSRDPGVTFSLQADHRPVEWAVDQGYAPDRAAAWGWLQAMAIIYLVDRHGATLPRPGDLSDDDMLKPVIVRLAHKRCVVWDQDGRAQLGPTGRELVTSLLAETERLIAEFDIYQDVLWRPDTQTTEFGTGRGGDLRVAVMVAHELDPLRAVFLLRLYDGSLDTRAATWREAADPAVLEWLLAPVVDRQLPEPDPRILADIINDGLDALAQ